MAHAISPCVQDALDTAVRRDDLTAILDCFIELYVLAQLGPRKASYAKGVDELCVAILTHEVEL